MTVTRPWQWRYKSLTDQGLASNPAVYWRTNSFAPGPDILAGETVMRSRLQISLVFGVGSLGGTDVPLSLVSWQAQQIRVGLYADKTLPSTDPPPGVATDVSDGNWIMNDIMTVHQVNYWTDPVGNNNQEIIYKYDSGTSDSEGRRGPYTVDVGTVHLVWDFSDLGPWYLVDDGTYLGWQGGQAMWTVGVLGAPS